MDERAHDGLRCRETGGPVDRSCVERHPDAHDTKDICGCRSGLYIEEKGQRAGIPRYLL